MEDQLLEIINLDIAIAIIIFVLSFSIGYFKVQKFNRTHLVSDVCHKGKIEKKLYVIANISVIVIIGFTIFNNLLMPTLMEYYSYLTIYLIKVIIALIIFFTSYQLIPVPNKEYLYEGRFLLSIYFLLPYSGLILEWINYPIAIFTAPSLIVFWFIIRRKSKKKYKELFEKRDRYNGLI